MSSLLYIHNADAAMHLIDMPLQTGSSVYMRLLSQTDMPAGHGICTMRCQLAMGYTVE